MNKNLIVICLIILSLSFISCARRLSYSERYMCSECCINNHCSNYMKSKSVDNRNNPNGIMIYTVDPACIYKCVIGCKYSDGFAAKEFELEINKE